MNRSWKIEPSIETCANECGAKCCRAPGYFPLTNDEYRRLKKINPAVKALRHDRNTWVLDHGFNGGQCPFLSVSNQCMIYDDRPEACRRFPSRAYVDCLVWPR